MENNFDWLIFFTFFIMLIAFVVSVISMMHSLLLSTCFPKSSVGTLLKSGFKLTFAFFIKGNFILCYSNCINCCDIVNSSNYIF